VTAIQRKITYPKFETDAGIRISIKEVSKNLSSEFMTVFRPDSNVKEECDLHR
jgi:hypothetical protein